jgi:hypothetical protein
MLDAIRGDPLVKVFKFDPATGKRGELIGTRKRASWTDSLWLGYDGQTPVGFGADADVGVHHDAGTGLVGDEMSYRHETEWTCFCLGCWHMGPDDNRWQWVIVPPTRIETRA